MRSSLCPSLSAVSKAVRNKVTKTVSEKTENTVEEQLSGKTNRPVRRAQLHLPTVSEKQLLRNNSAAGLSIQL